MSVRDHTHGISTGHVHDAGRTAGASTGSDTYYRHRAVRVIAANANDAAECAEVLAMLGLTAAEGKRRGEAA